MNKLFSKIAALSVGLALAVGVGVAAGQKDAVKVEAADSSDTFTLSSGVFADSKITWVSNNEVVSMIQSQGSGINAVNSSYISAPRVYAGHILEFKAETGVKIKSVTITVNGTYYGNNLAIGTVLNDTSVTDDPATVARTITTTSGGNHVLSSSTGLDKIYLQNTCSGANTQLRFTSVTLTYEGTPADKFVISFAAGEGSGTMLPAKVTGGENYQLPTCTFNEPIDKTFDCWSLGGTRRDVGYEFTVTEDTEVTALWKDREDLPVGEYTVEVSYAGRTSVPESEYFEIKEAAGVKYKTLRVEYFEVRRQYSDEYTLNKSKNSYINVFTNSNATIKSVTFDFYQRECDIKVDDATIHTASQEAGSTHRSLELNIGDDNFKIFNGTSYDRSIWGFTVKLKVEETPSPTVSFDNISSSLYLGDYGTFHATTEHATNPVITWSSGNPEVLTVDQNSGAFSANKLGEATLTVNMTCTEGNASKTMTVVVSGAVFHKYTVEEAIAIGETIVGTAPTSYTIEVEGFITSLEESISGGKPRAINISDNKLDYEGTNPTIMVYGIFSDSPYREYIILNGTISFRAHLQIYNSALQLTDYELLSYSDGAEVYSKYAYEYLNESCTLGPNAVTNEQWSHLSSEYSSLDEYAREKLSTASASYPRKVVKDWISRYGRIVASGKENFMHNDTLVGANIGYNLSNNGLGFIIIISIISTSALVFGLYFIIRKKKEQ